MQFAIDGNKRAARFFARIAHTNAGISFKRLLRLKKYIAILDGVIEDMKDLGLQPPIPRDIRSALEEWEKQHGKQND